jgi:hypothetical protein
VLSNCRITIAQLATAASNAGGAIAQHVVTSGAGRSGHRAVGGGAIPGDARVMNGGCEVT